MLVVMGAEDLARCIDLGIWWIRRCAVVNMEVRTKSGAAGFRVAEVGAAGFFGYMYHAAAPPARVTTTAAALLLEMFSILFLVK